MFILVLFFFFKQKTAYEMRISDWSSDVCSSDLAEQPVDDQSHVRGQTHRRPAGRGRTESLPDRPRRGALAVQAPRCTEHPLLDELRRALHQRLYRAEQHWPALRAAGAHRRRPRRGTAQGVEGRIARSRLACAGLYPQNTKYT